MEKEFKSSVAARKEADILIDLQSKGLRVPRVLKVEDNLIHLEYIKAITLPDIIDIWEESPDEEQQEKVINQLIEWLAKFYEIVNTLHTNEIRGDVNGRNFIFDGERIWGVDFEERSYGKMVDDIGLLTAFISTYKPVDTPLKQRLIKAIQKQAAQVFDLSKYNLKKSHNKGRDTLKQRRAKLHR